MRLLVIEDEDDLVRALKRGFEKRGYAVDTAQNGIDGLNLAEVNGYDLILLDLNLPGMDGTDVLRAIRRTNREQKILILSARSAYPERVEGLDLGANDYLVKPFDFGELEARVRSLLRRSFTQNDVAIRFGVFCMDTAARRVSVKTGGTVELAPKEFAILEYLLLNRGRAVGVEELIEHIWADDESMFSNAVKVHISTLRKKLAQHTGADVVVNVRGAGYLVEQGKEEAD